MNRSAKQKRPRTVEFVGNAEGFIAAMRTFHGIAFRKFATAVSASVRGKHRRGSENYLYRLCNGQTKLKPELIDGIARALTLSPAEVRFLQQSVEQEQAAPPVDTSSRKKQSRKLLQVLAGKGNGTAGVATIKAMINPVVIAVYTLIGRGDVTVERLPKAVAGAATGGKVKAADVKEALELLLSTGAVEVDVKTGLLRHTHAEADLAVHLRKGTTESAKSEALKLYYAALDSWGAEALYRVEREHRQFQSLTFLLQQERVQEMNRELAEAWRQAVSNIRAKYESADGDVVYHAGLRAWPMLEAAGKIKGEKS
jgi:hypothetical protein